MSILTLTTDLGLKDHYVGVVKGTILTHCKGTTIIDISHQVERYNIADAAFILRNTYPSFPAGTINIISVDPLDEREIKHLLILHEEQYFIGADTGLFSLLFDKVPDTIIQLKEQETLFPIRDIYATAACNLIKDTPPEKLGTPVSTYREKVIFVPQIEENAVRGTVIYVDAYENVITNITKSIFDNACNNRQFSVLFRRSETVGKISDNYYDVPPGELLTFFNSAGYLEIAINKGAASSLLGLKKGDIIQIDFT